MKRIVGVGLFGLILSSLGLNAQVNKIVNPNFDEVTKKIKDLGGVENSVGWYSPLEMEPADIFLTELKKGPVMIPENIRGRAETVEGSNYAGILAYSEREAQPRTYLVNKMEKKLVAGKTYCVTMHLSLSDLSKYSCDNVGIYISSKDIKKKNIEEYSITPQITYHENGLVDEMFDWVKICGKYEADGSERYIAIGNFAPQSAVKTGKMRRPREFKVPQTRDAYYYVDAVSLVALDHLDQPCDCAVKDAEGPQLDVVYTKNVSEGIEGTVTEKIEHVLVHFDNNSKTLNESDKMKADEVASLLAEDPTLNIMIIGHTSEAEEYDLSIERAKGVYTYLVTTKKIDANRLDYAGKGYDEPKAEGNDGQSNAENRRVEFQVK